MSDPSPYTSPQTGPEPGENDMRLFWACFIALIATAFGFIIRALIMDDWAREFNLNESQKGEIFGAGLWPFAISIILFSLVIDRIGYGPAMVFAFVCHVASAAVTMCAPMVAAGDSKTGYWMLYLGNVIVALGNGTVEAVVNPVVATMFARQKTKWLNILHAGWPGGLVVGGIITIMLSGLGVASWQPKIALILIPTVLYGVLMLGRKFPISERVAAGVSYKEMLKEFGALGAFVAGYMIFAEITRIIKDGGLMFTDFSDMQMRLLQFGIAAAIAAAFGAYVKSLGRPMFIFLLLIMIPLATTELGTDSWITSLMEPQMKAFGLHAGWLLVYTSLIMMILRFFAGHIVHRISPLGLLAASAVVAALGLVALSQAAGVAILAAATIYGFGKTFFWPTMLGVVAERFPKGGALTLNATGGVGMLAVGVVGAPFLGYIQDTAIEKRVNERAPALHAQLIAPKPTVFGTIDAVQPDKVAKLSEVEKEQVASIEFEAKKGALMTVAIFPCIMFVCYVALLLYFRSVGGYQAEVLAGHAAEDEKFTGGVVGPADA